MDPRVARFLAKHALSSRAAVESDVARYRGKSLDELGRDVTAVCRSAAAILAASPHRDAIRAQVDAPHPTYRAIIERLRERR